MTPFCEPLRVLLKAVFTSFYSSVWSFLLLAIIEICAALFMTQVLADTITDETLDLDLRRFVYQYYGTTSRTVLTMFQVTMAPNAWSKVGRPLVDEVSPVFGVFFVVYVGGVSFVIMKVISALFLRQTLAEGMSDEQAVRNQNVKSQRLYSEEIREVFIARDENGIGRVSFSQFQTFLKEEQGKAWLSVLELDEKDAKSIFHLVNDGDGSIKINDFLLAVFRLKEVPKQIDIVLLQRETKQLSRIMSGCQTQLQDISNFCQQLAERTFGTAQSCVTEQASPGPLQSKPHRELSQCHQEIRCRESDSVTGSDSGPSPLTSRRSDSLTLVDL
eukprot:gnl/MRDRNA2_/MRDRNA2_76132_c0_seq2.p1 gnl/MRDRNA2_/MRDRNA2_76132_c0~~gnl/MRDRNA2_/MRDRNA2_76132_c0_seq2.p1  ORF type:complete len:363 (-),score=43.29 gnl/MRDRNA2_/MRDRNA2_76132_c0_seq2:15-1004(-)